METRWRQSTKYTRPRQQFHLGAYPSVNIRRTRAGAADLGIGYDQYRILPNGPGVVAVGP